MSGAMILGGLVAFALVTGLSPSARKREAPADTAFRPATPPERLRKQLASYSQSEALSAKPGQSSTEAEIVDPLTEPQFPDAPAARAEWPGEVGGDTGVSGRGAPPASFGGGSIPVQAVRGGERAEVALADKSDADARISPIRFGAAASAPSRTARDAMVSGARLQAPQSGYILQAGSVISAALRTALNSEAPGRVVAQVIAPVYDSISGEHLLAPQGARLLGTYEAGAQYGDRRIRIVWNRLILPDGNSLDLQEMAAVDASGAAGLGARVDDHVGRIAAASVISGALSTAANAAQDRESSIFAQSVGDAAAQEAARVGGRIVDRELDVRPSLRAPAGARIKVLIERDLVFRMDGR